MRRIDEFLPLAESSLQSCSGQFADLIGDRPSEPKAGGRTAGVWF